VAIVLCLAACKANSSAQRAAPPSQPIASSVAPTVLAIVAKPAETVSVAGREPSVRPLLVPQAARALTPSSHFDINFWGNAVNTHTLLDAAGKGAVPVSEARFLWGQGQLYVAFYAGDLDLEVREKSHDGPVWKDDSVTLSFFTEAGKKRLISVSPTGVLADGTCPGDAKNLGDTRCDLHWESHARVGVDYDGTLNKLGDFDEEWNIQFAIPLRALDAAPEPGTRLRFALDRCDMAFDGQRACGAWGTSLTPAELVLQ